MSNNTEEQITQNVLDSLAQMPNPRLKEVMVSLTNDATESSAAHSGETKGESHYKSMGAIL